MCVHLRKNGLENKSKIIFRPLFLVVREYPKTPIFKKKEEENLANRTRKNRVAINLTDEEKEFFEQKKEEAGAKSMAHYIRKTVLEKEIYEVDLSPFYEIQDYLKDMTDYLNQVAKQVNQTGILYKKDMDQLKTWTDELKKKMWEVHDILR